MDYNTLKFWFQINLLLLFNILNNTNIVLIYYRY